MRVPLDVLLTNSADTNKADHIGGRLADLQLSAASPGGYTGGSFTFDQPITSDYLKQFDTVGVYDRNSAVQVGGGRLTDPGRSADENGEVWSVTFVGEGPSHVQDQTLARLYIETQLDGWYQRSRRGAAGTSQIGGTPDGSASSSYAINLSAPGGAVASGVTATMHHERCYDCGMTLGGFGYTDVAGQIAAGWKNESLAQGFGGSPATTTMVTASWNTATANRGPFVVNTDWTAGSDVLRVAIDRTGVALTVVDDTSWGSFYNIYVRSRMMDATGAYIANASHANAYVLASDVVADLVGRDLPRFDGVNASISTTTQHIDQLSYIDGATAGTILDDLIALESAYTWHVWNLNPSTSKYQFEWLPWSTTVRYEASVVDGFSSPSPSSDLYNQVNVRYRDQNGRAKFVLRTQTVAALGSLTRTGYIDLSDEAGSLANAQRVGDRFLATHQYPPNAGTLTVAHPIEDLTTGRLIKPWEIRPGNLIRVRGVRPYVDSLNATDRDGVTVFRIKSVTWSDSDGAATLELDTYSRTEARAIADLTNKRSRKR